MAEMRRHMALSRALTTVGTAHMGGHIPTVSTLSHSVMEHNCAATFGVALTKQLLARAGLIEVVPRNWTGMPLG